MVIFVSIRGCLSISISLFPESNKAAKFNDGDSFVLVFPIFARLYLSSSPIVSTLPFRRVAGTLKSFCSQISSISALLPNASEFIGEIAPFFFLFTGGVMEEPGQLKRAVINATAGLVAGGISQIVTSPLDVIKIRFQVQLEPTSSWGLVGRNMCAPSKYNGMFQAARDIFREESLPGFWRGNAPALLMGMTYSAIQFTVLHKLKTLATGSSKSGDHVHLSPYLSYISGALAGCAATVGSYPFDLLRTLLASQGEPKVYPTMRSAFVEISTTRGFRGLYAGLSPTLAKIVPYAGLQFGTYDTFKRWTMVWNQYTCSNTNSYSRDNSLTSFQVLLCGLAAGTCAKLVCHPLDVVKKRFQVQGLERHPRYGARVEHRAYSNMVDALQRIVQKEGLAGLYKGILPSTVKAAPATAVTFVAYEYASHWLESILT